jgi:hypothetical protein
LIFDSRWDHRADRVPAYGLFGRETLKFMPLTGVWAELRNSVSTRQLYAATPSTDHLSTKLAEAPPNNTHWINPAPSGGSTVIDLSFTNDSEAILREALKSEPANLEHKLLAYSQLQDGEAFSISTWHSDKADKVFRVLAAPHDPRDLLIFPIDPDNTGRPVRLTLFSNPKDGDLMDVWELGGYWHAPLTDAEWKMMCRPYKPTDMEEAANAEG